MKHQRYHNLLKAIEEERKNEEAYYRELSKSATSKDKIESGILWYPVDIVKQRYTDWIYLLEALLHHLLIVFQ